MRKLLVILSIVCLIACSALVFAGSISAQSNPWGGSITVCTVKLSNGILRQCTPTPGIAKVETVPTATQTEDQADLNIAFVILSTMLNTPVNIHNSTVTITPKLFSNITLECPSRIGMSGASMEQGFIILITFKGITYDFRANVNGPNAWFCQID